eukprot:gb/GEZN01009281.1/.p1 GENE.gb/GEZN01009281.1/~~gb/GEZN01009281.1/.p1  ORF type:complete len:188 (-),score=26.02 gb/GEZN01009281.1/:178-741(-)
MWLLMGQVSLLALVRLVDRRFLSSSPLPPSQLPFHPFLPWVFHLLLLLLGVVSWELSDVHYIHGSLTGIERNFSIILIIPGVLANLFYLFSLHRHHQKHPSQPRVSSPPAMSSSSFWSSPPFMFLLCLFLLLTGFLLNHLDAQKILCWPDSLFQGHALWHMETAGAAWLVLCLYRDENFYLLEGKLF